MSKRDRDSDSADGSVEGAQLLSGLSPRKASKTKKTVSRSVCSLVVPSKCCAHWPCLHKPARGANKPNSVLLFLFFLFSLAFAGCKAATLAPRAIDLLLRWC